LYKILIIILSGVILAQDEGLKAYQSGDYENARKYYESILIEKDKNAAAQFGLGTSAFQQQDLKGALDAFQRSLDTKDTGLQSKAYYNMANLLASQQKNEEALGFYRKALELDPTDKDAKHNYEIIRYQHQEQQEQQSQDQQQEQQEQQSQDQQQQDQNKEVQEKQQDLQHAQAILDALKKDEKVNQKRQMSKARSKKLEKDW